jgi:hypothetical protein
MLSKAQWHILVRHALIVDRSTDYSQYAEPDRDMGRTGENRAFLITKGVFLSLLGTKVISGLSGRIRSVLVEELSSPQSHTAGEERRFRPSRGIEERE